MSADLCAQTNDKPSNACMRQPSPLDVIVIVKIRCAPQNTTEPPKIEAVSYTHLDVYKRQALVLVNECFIPYNCF